MGFFWDDDTVSNLDDMLSLKKSTRFYICIGAIVLGFLSMFLSTFTISAIAIKPGAFAIPFTFGNICVLVAIAMLIGPWRCIKIIFQPRSLISTLLLVGSIILCFICSFVWKSALLTFFAILLELAAVVWFILSFIPGGQWLFKRGISSGVQRIL
eukprot:TRINITY_DN422_c0_g1_i1.p1 TRINITY_DN422_c0_g1~~TRINITY_DN422_c0_g1_i1.p1  ORF type:complete len:155 (+),score=32.20 TRINITY_DN422_c0_g1_i1:40-504(+)